jgi:predicted DNA-binding transcriptional regulator AlpA
MERDMTKKQEPQPRSLHPDQIYRPSEARLFFGFRATQLTEKIKAGEIPAPMKLSDSGHAVGWLGSVIIAWQAARVAAATKRKVAA